MTTMANTFGALEIGSAFTVFLFGIITLQVHLYFQRFPEDRLPFKVLVGLIWCMECGHTAAIIYEVYRTTITFYGLSLKVAMRHPALGGVVIVGTYIATLVQAFFCYRVWTIIPKPYNIIGPLTAFVAFARAVIVTYAGIREVLAVSYVQFMRDMEDWVMALLAIGAVIDIIIAASMMWYLMEKREKTFVKTSRLIDRLIGFTVRTGLMTSVVAIAVIIIFRTMPHNLVYVAVYSALSKLYTNSLLSGLNARLSLRDTLSNSVSVDVLHRGPDGTARYPPQDNVSLPYATNGAISIEMKTTTEFRADDFDHQLETPVGGAFKK